MCSSELEDRSIEIIQIEIQTEKWVKKYQKRLSDVIWHLIPLIYVKFEFKKIENGVEEIFGKKNNGYKVFKINDKHQTTIPRSENNNELDIQTYIHAMAFYSAIKGTNH